MLHLPRFRLHAFPFPLLLLVGFQARPRIPLPLLPPALLLLVSMGTLIWIRASPDAGWAFELFPRKLYNSPGPQALYMTIFRAYLSSSVSTLSLALLLSSALALQTSLLCVAC